ncbi:MAG TPA: SDR family NAD(P)-dependent oxidoreductase, partial [Thermomicrobiales bacterium]|nr:SDR family NAD(P)-dependent oxidoreductase [Thermomicrobiales bacterium]
MFDVRIYDGQGNPVLEIRSYAVRFNSAVTYWRPDWIDASADPAPAVCTVLLTGNADAAEKLSGPVIVVTPADRFADLAQYRYTVNPYDPATYRALFADLGRRGLRPERVVHHWKLDHPTKAFLASAQGIDSDIELVAILDATAQSSAVAGAARTLALESGKIRPRVIWAADLPDFTSGNDVEVRYTNGRRQIRAFERLNPDRPASSLLREGGVYLITGATGGIGRHIADYLIRTVRAKVALVSRSSPHIAEDVSTREGARRAVERTIREFGALHGVIHCAGVTRDAFVIRKDLATVDEVFGPKADAAVYLDEATRDLSLDFFLLGSSTASVFGNPGQSDYAAANRFLDAFAQWRQTARP